MSMRWTRVLLPILLLAPTLTGCSLVRGRGLSPSEAGVPEPGTRTRELPGNDAGRITSEVVATALDAVGTPYVWGGTGANGFDCSGLIQYAYAQHGIRLPRISTDQLREGREIEPRQSALLAGDILGFSVKAGEKSTHVGLYVGNGDFIHSSSNGVRTSSLTNPYWQENFVQARRVVW